MEKYRVAYQAGESRMNPGQAIDYMLVMVDDVELYAEAIDPTWDDEAEEYTGEGSTYDELKAAILEQAEENGIAAEVIDFPNDIV